MHTRLHNGLFGGLRAATTGRLDDWTTGRLCVAVIPVQCSFATSLRATFPLALAWPHLVYCAVSINTVFLIDPVRWGEDMVMWVSGEDKECDV